MNPKHLIYYTILTILIIAGCFVSGFAFSKAFWGGIISGSGLSMLIAILAGKRVAEKAAERIDKRVKDILIED